MAAVATKQSDMLLAGHVCCRKSRRNRRGCVPPSTAGGVTTTAPAPVEKSYQLPLQDLRILQKPQQAIKPFATCVRWITVLQRFQAKRFSRVLHEVAASSFLVALIVWSAGESTGECDCELLSRYA